MIPRPRRARQRLHESATPSSPTASGRSGRHDSLQPGPADPKITFGSILELEDVRVGINNLSVTVGTAIDSTARSTSLPAGRDPARAPVPRRRSRTATPPTTRTPTGRRTTRRSTCSSRSRAARSTRSQFKVDTMSVTLGSLRDESARELARRGVAAEVALERAQHRPREGLGHVRVVGGRRQRALVLAPDRELGQRRALPRQARR